jgi:hypothetical protein
VRDVNRWPTCNCTESKFGVGDPPAASFLSVGAPPEQPACALDAQSTASAAICSPSSRGIAGFACMMAPIVCLSPCRTRRYTTTAPRQRSRVRSSIGKEGERDTSSRATWGVRQRSVMIKGGPASSNRGGASGWKCCQWGWRHLNNEHPTDFILSDWLSPSKSLFFKWLKIFSRLNQNNPAEAIRAGSFYCHSGLCRTSASADRTNSLIPWMKSTHCALSGCCHARPGGRAGS